ncbi:MAG: DUF2804 domain-containing protein [Polyangiaceae bacterium]|nr:DUF2804 domain-containing protein [Polyangiaceae bacterium]
MGDPSFGSFAGGLPRMDFGPIPKGRLWKLVHGKRWTYVGVADEQVFAGMAVVSLSYAAAAMVFVLDRKSGELIVDKSAIGPATAVRFEDCGDGKRSATFELGRTRVQLSDENVLVDLLNDATSELPTHLMFRPVGPGPSPLAAVVPIEGGYANATEKRLVEVTGEIVAKNRRYVLGGARPALAAFDHTAGFLARHTAWCWALGMGYASTGERIAFNLVEGFVGEAECGGWIGDELVGLGEGRFEFDKHRPSEPWKLKTTCGSVDLLFRPAAIHAEDKDMLLVRSKFIQPIGSFEGTLRLGGRTHEVKGLPGVTEHQDVLW